MTNSTSSSGENLPHGIHLSNADLLIISIVAIVVGVGLTFLGRKLFKATLFVAGFVSFAGLAYYCINEVAVFKDHVHFNSIEGILIPAGVGLVGGCVVLGVLQLGFFLAGAAAGAAISFMIFSVVGNHLGEHANIIRLVILIVLSLLCGAAVVKQERRLIVLITSIGGAYMTMAGADHFVKSGYVQAINGIFIKEQIPIHNVSPHLLMMFGATLALAVVGFIVQSIHNRNKDPVSGWEENQYLLRGKSVNY
eukprot:Phypoly_transcript_14338.p1 GENE.Phypoly_transcript_14338~~Phypoly_transcript_14338.p1  ORF type:complete len:270 (+),score=48.99 Phypoly_transcript_14338:59-811(+)